MLIWYLPAVNLILLLPILVIQNEFFCEWCKFFYSVINGFNVKYFIPQNTFSENLEALKAPNFIICQQPWCLQGKTTISENGVPPPQKKKQNKTKKTATNNKKTGYSPAQKYIDILFTDISVLYNTFFFLGIHKDTKPSWWNIKKYFLPY